ncbi:MAG: hypothetical protein ABF289_11865, partial [Clostridiales bacterium]
MISIIGNNFESNSKVILKIANSTYEIPSSRTTYINSTQIDVNVGLTDVGYWKAIVENSNGYVSNNYDFYVQKNSVSSSPNISEINPNSPNVSSTRQWISINGSNFVSGVIVSLKIGINIYEIPSSR